MATISELRAQFEGMSTNRKRQFCEDLQRHLEGSDNAEHRRFLYECINRHNAELRGEMPAHSPFGPGAPYQQAAQAGWPDAAEEHAESGPLPIFLKVIGILLILYGAAAFFTSAAMVFAAETMEWNVIYVMNILAPAYGVVVGIMCVTYNRNTRRAAIFGISYLAVVLLAEIVRLVMFFLENANA